MDKVLIYKLTPSLLGGGQNNTIVCLNNNKENTMTESLSN